MQISSYPKVWTLGHSAVADLTAGPVVVEEKIDGSQFSFCRTAKNEILFRSKRTEIFPDAAGMFARAVAEVQARADALRPGWVYRAEFLAKPKHNALAYSRVPRGHLILFDVETGPSAYLSPRDVSTEAERLGLEAVPVFSFAMDELTAERLKAFLENESCLGGQRVEGVVIKNYMRFGADGKPLFGKYISEAYKEKHASEWRTANPTRGDVVEQIIVHLVADYRRWEKAIEKRRDQGLLESSPRDIGPLMRDIQTDVLDECQESIKDALFRWAWPQIKRRIVSGLPAWYKARLLDQQFIGVR